MVGYDNSNRALYEETSGLQRHNIAIRKVLCCAVLIILIFVIMILVFLLLPDDMNRVFPERIRECGEALYKYRTAIWIALLCLSFKLYQTGVSIKRNGDYIRYAEEKEDAVNENDRGKIWKTVLNVIVFAMLFTLLIYEKRTGIQVYLHPLLFFMEIYMSVLYLWLVSDRKIKSGNDR